jgi:hypothetical protein
LWVKGNPVLNFSNTKSIVLNDLVRWVRAESTWWDLAKKFWAIPSIEIGIVDFLIFLFPTPVDERCASCSFVWTCIAYLFHEVEEPRGHERVESQGSHVGIKPPHHAKMNFKKERINELATQFNT